jgi:hypothetical protein
MKYGIDTKEKGHLHEKYRHGGCAPWPLLAFCHCSHLTVVATGYVSWWVDVHLGRESMHRHARPARSLTAGHKSMPNVQHYSSTFSFVFSILFFFAAIFAIYTLHWT